MGPYKNLDAWKMGIELAKCIYTVTEHFPKAEMFGLVSQMRRCSVSISSNIAEGYGRGSNQEIIHFLFISLGSSNELDTQLTISKELGFLSEDDYQKSVELNERVNKMLKSLIYTRQNKVIGSEVINPKTPEPQNPKTE